MRWLIISAYKEQSLGAAVPCGPTIQGELTPGCLPGIIITGTQSWGQRGWSSTVPVVCFPLAAQFARCSIKVCCTGIRIKLPFASVSTLTPSSNF